MTSPTRLSVVPLALTLLLAFGAIAIGQQATFAPTELPERFRAFATNLGDVATTLDNRPVDIRIDRWSGPKEGEMIVSMLREHGEKGLLDWMQDRPRLGSIASQGSLAYPLKYATEQPWGDGGRELTLITDRYVAFWELAGSARTRDYPYSVIKLFLKHDGTGEGTMSLATRIHIQADILVFEEFATQPIRLMSVKRENRKK